MLQKRNNALKQGVLSVVFSLIIILVFLVGLIPNFLSRMPDVISLVIISIAFLFAIPGAVLAVSAKKNNVNENKKVLYISALGMLISCIDIFLFIIIFPVASSAILFRIKAFNVVSIGISFSLGFAVIIILFVAFRRAKPKQK